jgi:hypothetical protein
LSLITRDLAIIELLHCRNQPSIPTLIPMYASMNPSPSYNLTIRRPSLRPQRPFSSSLSRSVQLHRPGPSTHSQNYKRSHTQKYYAYIVTAAPLAKKKRARCPDKHTKSFPKKSTESRGPINVPKTCRDLKSSYLIVSKLGEGAFGKVYISEDRISGERCVVKMIKSSYKEEQDSGFSICALREINLLKSMCYESIVLLKDVVTHTGTCMKFSLVVLISIFSFANLLLLFRTPHATRDDLYGIRVPGV